jgi:hypothetical protein
VNSDVFRCDYCGTYAPLHRSTVMFTWAAELDNGDDLYHAAIFCSTYCGGKAGETSVGS